MNFNQVEAEYDRLKGQFEAGTLTEEQFKSQLQDLMLQDDAGEWWVIGYETGQWYRHDGTGWVRADPPGHIEADMPPPPATHPESTTSKSVTQSTRPGYMSWNPVVLVSIGWVIIWGIIWSIPWLFELVDSIDEGVGLIVATLCAVLSGLVCGLVLQWNSLSIRWLHTIIIAAGWAIGWAIVLIDDNYFYWRLVVWDEPIGINELANLIIIGVISGSVIGLILKWADPPTKWKKVVIIAGGWVLAFCLGFIFSPRIYLPGEISSIFVRFAVTGLVIGAIGSGIMFWQLGQHKKIE